MIRLDYETFSHADLPRCGMWAYARHPTTQVLGVAWAVDDGEPHHWDILDGGPLPILRALMADAAQLVSAWNAGFEYAITKHAFRALPLPPLPRWRDTAAVAAMCTYPRRLGDAAAVLKVAQQKDTDGKRLLRIFSLPQKDGSRVMPADRPDEFRAYMAYMRQDVRTERDVANALPIRGLPPFEQRVWAADLRINERGVRVNVPMIRGALKIAARAKVDGARRLKESSGGVVTSPSQRDRIVAYCAAHGHVLPNLEKMTVATALEDPELPAKVRALLEIRNAFNVSSVAKYPAMNGALSGDRVCGVHLYGGADTLRWAGRIAQFQNLPRPAQSLPPAVHKLIAEDEYDLLQLWGDPLAVLRDALRNTVIPSAGRKLVVADMSSIEARVLGWLAGDPGYMAAYRGGLDLYVVVACKIFNKDYRKLFDAYKGGGEWAVEMRRVGKACVLGLGYSMGRDTFLATCRKNGLGTPEHIIERALKVYRRDFRKIPEMWRGVEQMCMQVLADRKPRTGWRVRVAFEAGAMTIRLPSGRKLWYPGAHLRMKQTKFGPKQIIHFFTSFGTHWLPSHTYGGRLTENIDQAISRDLLAHALVELDEGGHCPVLHVHDEVASDSATPEKTFTATKHLLTSGAPAWAEGLPLECNGFITDYYRK